jgi:hypothetical protein
MEATDDIENIYYCDLCDYYARDIYNFNRHIKSKKHIIKGNEADNINTNNIITTQEQENKFVCVNCNYETHHLSNFLRHKETRKHKLNMPEEEKVVYKCVCGKIYKFASGLSKHKQKCVHLTNKLIELTNIDEDNNQLITMDSNDNNLQKILLKILEQNSDLMYEIKQKDNVMLEQQQTLIEMAKEPKIINNNDNRSFNVMNFLNNECKDAYNLSEFVEKLEYTFKDLLQIEHEGWQKNVKSTFINAFKSCDMYKRPIHCSDKKRKKFYIKEDNKWEIDVDNVRLNRAIRVFHNKQTQICMKWKAVNKAKIDTNDEMHDRSMLFNLELCSISRDEGPKMIAKIMSDMTELSLPRKSIKN